MVALVPCKFAEPSRKVRWQLSSNTETSAVIMNYADAIKYLYSVRLFGTKLGLANTKHLFEQLGHPEEEFFTIHVAGTNGKGSVCALLNSILTRAGYTTGVFTSPHILSFRERISAGDEMIGEEAVCRHLTRLLPIIQKMSKHPSLTHPTFFEIVTALAVDYFAAQKVDIAIVETGMGGRLDATNAIPSTMQVITSIGLEHTEHLGSTIEDIAAEKAGIIKENAAVIVGEENEAALRVIRSTVAEKKATLRLLGRDIRFRNRRLSLPFQEFDVASSRRQYPKVVLPLLGQHQAANACLAAAVCEELQSREFDISREHIFEGIQNVRCPGRFEMVSGQPTVILDGACNPHACRALVKTISEVLPESPLTLVIGILRDKDYRQMCEILLPIADNVILTEPRSPRALPVKQLREIATFIAPEKNIQSFESVEEAIEHTREVPSEDSFVCVTGSNYLLGPARKALGLAEVPEDFILAEWHQTEEMDNKAKTAAPKAPASGSPVSPAKRKRPSPERGGSKQPISPSRSPRRPRKTS